MATYRRKGDRPLSQGGFYSFVEDWARHSGANGHSVCRKADFRNQRLILDKKKTYRLSKARFTKVEHGRDQFACHKAVCGNSQQGGGFFLSSGGQMEHKEEEVCSNGKCLEC